MARKVGFWKRDIGIANQCSLKPDKKIPAMSATPRLITEQSLMEAERRHKLANSCSTKRNGYLLWLETMLGLEKIHQTDSTNQIKYFGPIVLVPKPNGAVRVTHDYSG
eukprot:GHVP01066483.1.p1 GENE.GHVP01066483.1~~GHVP01066483.1.p1  ORF type:complete len:108 (-),score=10.97 GHVP01066483.1:383-706(-)